MTSTPKPPPAFFDTLDEMPNPFKHRVTSVSNLVASSPANAVSDYQLASEFIYSYRGSNDTFSTYRREIEHFLHWCWIIRGKSLDEVGREHIEEFIDFSRAPPSSWIGGTSVPRFLLKGGRREPNLDWRPYVSAAAADGGEYTLSSASIQSLLGVLSSFYNYLIQEEYLRSNPVAQLRQKSKFVRKTQGPGKIRRLSPLQWDYLIDTTEALAASDPGVHERTLFILQALFAMYLRISELVVSERWQPRMGHFQPDAEGNWWFLTVGKGNKEREVSVSDAMLAALKRYRLSRGLAPLPSFGESTPLIHKTRGRGGITSTRQIRLIVQQCFDNAAAAMRRDGFDDDAQRLADATVHWLRHTGISEDVKHRPREHVRDDAGHGSSAITDRYIDVERAERHASARAKPIK
ncbi:MAG: tyrosine-type recombinase/integrase [Gammaproteobacteria bacterium]|nr:tyrosine-type recombinase/integrase [Gammaproteobacteria bacterium]